MLELRSIDDSNALFNDSTIHPAFSWWYVDVLNAKGDGCVCIFSQGLPFLPSSSVAKPDRFSVNVVLYKEGKESFYLLQEYPAAAVTRSVSAASGISTEREEIWQIGSHSFSRRIENGRVHCNIALHSAADTEAHAIVGNIQLSGALISNIAPTGRANSAHQWIPMSSQCSAEIAVETQAGSMSFRGAAYHDSNISRRMLEDLSIARWWWARISLENETWIIYLIDDEQSSAPPIWIVASVDGQGKWTEHTVISVNTHAHVNSIYGLSLPADWKIKLDSGTVLALKKQHWLDDSPFYQRVLVTLQIDGETGTGFMEHVVPPRLGIPWQQPFIRMKTHYQDSPGSFFSSLFTGPSKTRWSRQLSRCLPF